MRAASKLESRLATCDRRLKPAGRLCGKPEGVGSWGSFLVVILYPAVIGLIVLLLGAWGNLLLHLHFGTDERACEQSFQLTACQRFIRTSMAAPDDDLDIAAFSKTRPFTVEDLKRCSAADLDAHTIQVGQLLCKDIKFSNQGQRNLAAAFDSLPTNTRARVDFEVGFGTYHIIHTILRSDEGFTLAAIVGSLSEYFHQDVVVEFLLALCNKSRIPVAWRPLRHQWKGIVSALCGVLATSALGTLLTSIDAACQNSNHRGTSVDVAHLLSAFQALHDASKDEASHMKLRADRAFPWVAAIGQWLFGLKVAVVSEAGELLYSTGRIASKDEVDVQIEIGQDKQANEIGSLAISDGPKEVLGGRVAFETLFRTCFGSAFTNIPEELLAAFICCASIIVQGRLSTEKPDWARGLLTQPSSSSGAGQGLGPADTLSAWFPELQRLSPRFRKYSKLKYEEAKTTYDDTYRSLQQHCQCPWCNGAEGDVDNPRQPEKCSVIIAEFLLGPSLILARTFVAPRLLPKKDGCVELLRRWSSFFTMYRKKDVKPSDIYLPHVGAFVSSTSGMIKLAVVLFANSTSPEIETEKDLMGITHNGLAILSTGQKDFVVTENVPNGKREQQWKQAIQVSSGWLCLFGHEAKLEVFEQLPDGVKFGELELLVSQQNKLGETRQFMKWRDGCMATGMAWKGTEGEQEALRDGWEAI